MLQQLTMYTCSDQSLNPHQHKRSQQYQIPEIQRTYTATSFGPSRGNHQNQLGCWSFKQNVQLSPAQGLLPHWPTSSTSKSKTGSSRYSLNTALGMQNGIWKFWIITRNHKEILHFKWWFQKLSKQHNSEPFWERTSYFMIYGAPWKPHLWSFKTH